MIASLSGTTRPPVTLHRFFDVNTSADLSSFLDLIQADELSLLVTACRDAFNGFADPIREAAERRRLPLCIISADNRTPDGWRNFRNDPPRNVVALQSIADRICVRFPHTHAFADVLAEDYGTWVIERDRDGRLQELSANSGGIELVDDANIAINRKLLLVNGLQLALAVLAWTDGQPFLHEWIRTNSGLTEDIGRFFATAYHDLYPGDAIDASVFVGANLLRFTETPDRSGRMLGLGEGSEFGDPADLRRKLEQRVLPITHGRSDSPLAGVVAKVENLILEWEMEAS